MLARACNPTQEAEAGESLESRIRRLEWTEIAPLHSSLDEKSETPSHKTKQNKIVREVLSSLEVQNIQNFIYTYLQLNYLKMQLKNKVHLL